MDNFPIYKCGVGPLAENHFRKALKRILRPIIRGVIARAVRFPDLTELIKEIYVDACERHFRLGGKRLTDSRVSLLTGLQRKDVREIRARLAAAEDDIATEGAGPIARLIAHWIATAPYRNPSGTPRPLHRTNADGSPAFDTLVGDISRDIHPRTVLDEMKRQGLVDHDLESDLVHLRETAYLPSRDEAALMGYFGANLGDHAEAAIANLDDAPEPGCFFERAVHYNRLTPQSVSELEALARRLQSDVLARLNTEALALQKRDKADPAADARFRLGAYFYHERSKTGESEE